MQVHLTSFWSQKAGNPPDEFEDAYFPQSSGVISRTRLRVAVADGATTGMLSGEWARILVRCFCRSQAPLTDLDGLLQRAYSSWEDWQQHYLFDRERSNRPIRWYEEPGLQAGAFATLVGIEVTPHFWQAIAIGDCCVFQIHANENCTGFPLTRSEQFGNQPPLIGSKPTANSRLAEAFLTTQGTWEVDDVIFLMSDALANWFLKSIEQGYRPWEPLRDLDTRDEVTSFAQFIDDLRQRRQIRNDDVTLTRIDLL